MNDDGPRPQIVYPWEQYRRWAEENGLEPGTEEWDRYTFGRMPQTLLPLELRERSQWVVWKYELNKEGTKWTKVPYQARNPDRKASTTNPATWSTFDAAWMCLDSRHHLPEEDRVDGFGYVFAEDDPYCGIDLDNCFPSGKIGLNGWGFTLLDDLGKSYAEKSPSGNGVKVIVRAKLPGPGNKKTGLPDGGAIEMYDHARFFTITGMMLNRWCTGRAVSPGSDRLVEGTIEDRQEFVTRLHAELFPPKVAEKAASRPVVKPARAGDESDDAILAKAKTAKNGAAFDALFRGDTSSHNGDDSAADLAFCSHLAFWFGGDVDAIDRVFRRSGLYRDKWDRADYRERTIAKALEQKAFYDPNSHRNGRPADEAAGLNTLNTSNTCPPP